MKITRIKLRKHKSPYEDPIYSSLIFNARWVGVLFPSLASEDRRKMEYLENVYDFMSRIECKTNQHTVIGWLEHKIKRGCRSCK